MYSKRIQSLCGELSKCDTFADIGCDHGYCTEYMLDNNLCNLAIIADISKESLKKAERLLHKFILKGQCKSVCSNGFKSIQDNVDLALIAGMGGKEIIKILEEGYIPKIFVLQPMRNTIDLREFLLNNNCAINRDFTFFDEKFYDVIVGSSSNSGFKPYSELELEFGRTNLEELSSDFTTKMKIEVEKIDEYLKRDISKETERELKQRQERIKGVLNG